MVLPFFQLFDGTIMIRRNGRSFQVHLEALGLQHAVEIRPSKFMIVRPFFRKWFASGCPMRKWNNSFTDLRFLRQRWWRNSPPSSMVVEFDTKVGFWRLVGLQSWRRFHSQVRRSYTKSTLGWSDWWVYWIWRFFESFSFLCGFI